MKYFVGIVFVIVAILVLVFVPGLQEENVLPEGVAMTETEESTTPQDMETPADIGFFDGTYTLVAEESRVDWQGYGVGKNHFGRIANVSGDLTVEGEMLTVASIELDMTSITVDDIAADAGGDMLLAHLSSADFFGVETYPTATLVGRDFMTQGDTVFVTGDLTIRDMTQEVTLPLTMTTDETTITANGAITLDRTEWDMTFRSGKFFENLGDTLINDDFDVTLSVLFERTDV
jgi:polyisoprenoid-binding protein YceI